MSCPKQSWTRLRLDADDKQAQGEALSTSGSTDKNCRVFSNLMYSVSMDALRVGGGCGGSRAADRSFVRQLSGIKKVPGPDLIYFP